MTMKAPLLLDLSHTSHTRARTGIQRVTRSLRAALSSRAVAITFDPYQDAWRTLEPWEEANLDAARPAPKRGARWPWHARLRGYVRRQLGNGRPSVPESGGVLVPELFSPTVSHALPRLFACTSGPRAALFHDAIALKLPEMTPAKTVARYPAYLRELLQFDGIAAVSEDSATALTEYWDWLDVRERPALDVIPLGLDLGAVPPMPEPPRPAGGDPVVLSVGSIEGRKNHLALLDAAERLWSEGRRFSLRLVGLAQSETGSAALHQIERLQTAGRPLRYDGPVGDMALSAAYQDCTFTVYPSLLEGFGLPVLESLARGRPCICSARGALGEAARGGGCLPVDPVDASTLADAMRHLLTDHATTARLAREASERRVRSWAEYAAALRDWLETVPRR